MKKPFYLVGLAALALVGCSDNDFFSGGPDDNFGQASKGQLAFGIKDESGKISRGEITGEKAAEKLNKKFTVYGWKYVNNNSDAAVGFEDVFQDYVVKWEGLGSAGTTESNTKGWEYVGYQSEPVNGATPYDQTIKYWDWSTDRYDFIAWSIGKDSKAQVLTRNVVPTSTKANAAEPGLTFSAPTAKDLGGVFVSDKFTSTPDGSIPAGFNSIGGSDLGLANVNTHPYPQGHIGKYSQMGTNVTANDEKGIVNLLFRNLAAKARIGIYETIPGYKVSNVVFYKETTPVKDANGVTSTGNNGYSLKWGVDDDNHDYKADQSYATLYADANIFARRGQISVKYHDAYYNEDGIEKDNVAYTSVTGDDKVSYYAFGQLTNEKGSTTVIGTNEIGVTSNTASMSIGNDADNLYTYVFPMEENANVLKLKVNYLLTSIDGSGEQIRVTGANAVVPVEFAKWKPNYAYTYLFKISDNTNGYTGGAGVNPAGLYPITFDACLVNTEDGMQQTITTVNDKSITTYQDGSEVTANNEYKLSNDIYFTIEGYEGSQSLHKPTKGTDVWLYTAWAADPSIITEEAVANYKANNIVLTDVTDQLSATSSAPNSSGAQYAIQFGTDMAMKFTPVAKYYVVKAKYTDTNSKTYLSYKVIKVEDGSYDKSYSITCSTPSMSNIGSTTFTITNGSDNVTGAAGAVKVTTTGTPAEDVTNRFTISEADTPNPYTYTIKSNGVPAGTYTVEMGGANQNIEVTAPVWYNADASATISTINVEEGHTVDVVLKDANGTAMAGVVPTITGGTTGKITASESTSGGKITLTASKGAAGTFTVSHNGADFTVNVDKYGLSLSRKIINVGDDQHKTATLTLTNAGTTLITGKTISVSAGENVTASTTATDASTTTSTITAAKAGTATLSYQNAKINIEVVDYVLQQAKTRDGALTVQLKQKKAGESTYSAVNGATTLTAEGCTITPTSTPGVYKVNSGAADKVVKFSYKDEVVADVTLGADPGSDPAL